MSYRDEQEAFLAYSGGKSLSPAEQDAFNAGWKARNKLAAKRERELVRALQIIHSFAFGDDAHDLDPEDLLERIRIEAYRQITKIDAQENADEVKK